MRCSFFNLLFLLIRNITERLFGFSKIFNRDRTLLIKGVYIFLNFSGIVSCLDQSLPSVITFTPIAAHNFSRDFICVRDALFHGLGLYAFCKSLKNFRDNIAIEPSGFNNIFQRFRVLDFFFGNFTVCFSVLNESILELFPFHASVSNLRLKLPPGVSEGFF